ncbi:MAG: tetratricopeptide repeat protein [Paludibaculum sp.]
MNPDAHRIAAASALETGKRGSAIRHLKRGAKLAPRDGRFPLALAEVLLHAGQASEALDWARRAFRLAPEIRETRLVLVRCLLLARLHQPAAELLDGQMGPEERRLLACAHAVRGMSLMFGRRYLDAADAYLESLSLAPRQSAVLSNLGGAYCMAGDLDAAEDYFRRAIKSDPSFLAARSNLLLCMHYPDAHSPAVLASEHRRQGRAWKQYAPEAPAVLIRRERRRPRIGFVSSDLRRAPVARFVEPFLRHYDRSRFHVTCYYSASVEDEYTRRLRTLSDRWQLIHGMTDLEAAQQIRADGCDLLIDLNGHNHGNRLGVFALRAAPVQAAYLGYPDTSGVAEIDYRISDAICDPPPRAQRYCTEKLVYVPDCFLCFQPLRRAPRVTPLPADRTGAVTFGCLNQLQKLSDAAIDLWAEILSKAPDARLLLKAASLADPRIAARTRERFEAEGIESARLDLRGPVAKEREHLATYGEVDIALDPFPYAGTTTTCEALWMGVPVLTLNGNCHASRVGASLLHAVGLDAFIAARPLDYVRIAVQAAQDRQRLCEIRAGLRGRMRESTLCDQAAFARKFERVLEQMIAG